MLGRGKKKIAPVVVAVLVALYVGPMVALLIVSMLGLAGMSGVGGMIPFLLLYALAGGAVIVGVLLAMAQRLREIDGGEDDEARQY